MQAFEVKNERWVKRGFKTIKKQDRENGTEFLEADNKEVGVSAVNQRSVFSSK